MECVGKTCCAAKTESAACRKIRLVLLFSGAGEGIRTPDPLITNQMLYRLSYASNSGESRAVARTTPSDPFRMSGTILKGITTAISGATACSAWYLPRVPE
jgi:hypothetical protein